MSEEYLDILDPRGNPTGRRAAKSEIHQQGHWHQTAHIWIVTPDGQVLLQRRGPTKKTHPNCWDISSAGHVSAGESSVASAIREIQEETGLRVTEKQLEFLFTIHGVGVFQDGRYINREYQDVFLVVTPVNRAKLPKPNAEVTDFMLVPWSQLRQTVQEKRADYVPHDQEYEKLFPLLEQRFAHAHTR